MNYPQYKCHKTVSAVKISVADEGSDGSLTLQLEGGFDNVILSAHDRKNKPRPHAGWYLVQYDNGYVSFSPADSFEDGYTLIDEEIPTAEAVQEAVETPEAVVTITPEGRFGVYIGSMLYADYENEADAKETAEKMNVVADTA